MKNESLDKIFEVVVKPILESDVDELDKVEAIINLKHFLNPKDYEKNIKVLKLSKGSKFDKEKEGNE